MHLLALTVSAYALTCVDPDHIEYVTPKVVPTNARLVVAFLGPVPEPLLYDADGMLVDAEVLQEAGHLIVVPDAPLAEGDYLLQVRDDLSFPITCDGSDDTSPPLPPAVDSAVHDEEDSWGYAIDLTEIRVRDVPSGSHIEVELTPPDGGQVLLAATKERLIEVGFDACGYGWPRRYDGSLDYDLRVRSVDAAGHPSSWVYVSPSIDDDEAEEAEPAGGCQTAPMVDPWGWLRRR